MAAAPPRAPPPGTSRRRRTPDSRRARPRQLTARQAPRMPVRPPSTASGLRAARRENHLRVGRGHHSSALQYRSQIKHSIRIAARSPVHGRDCVQMVGAKQSLRYESEAPSSPQAHLLRDRRHRPGGRAPGGAPAGRSEAVHRDGDVGQRCAQGVRLGRAVQKRVLQQARRVGPLLRVPGVAAVVARSALTLHYNGAWRTT